MSESLISRIALNFEVSFDFLFHPEFIVKIQDFLKFSSLNSVIFTLGLDKIKKIRKVMI